VISAFSPIVNTKLKKSGVLAQDADWRKLTNFKFLPTRFGSNTAKVAQLKVTWGPMNYHTKKILLLVLSVIP
jgi:hypothetical protein